eukprot:8218543-Alexandrium_andersonii.AAC.1
MDWQRAAANKQRAERAVALAKVARTVAADGAEAAMPRADLAWAVLQASHDDGGSGRPVVVDFNDRGACVLSAMHEPLGRWGGLLAVVLTTAPAASAHAQRQQQQPEGGHTEPLFFATQNGTELIARLPVEAAMLPTVAPAWHQYAVLAVVVARYVLAGRVDARGRLQGAPLVHSAGERGRALRVHPQARMRMLKGEQAGHVDALMADVPAAQADASEQDAAQLLVVYVHRQLRRAGWDWRADCLQVWPRWAAAVPH